jgi:hypothetical protein
MRKRALFLLLLASLSAAHGQSLDEAAHALGQKIAAHLKPGEVPHFTSHNISSFPLADLGRARTEITRTMRRTGRTAVEITLTLSENIRGGLLVAEIHLADGLAMETESYQPQPPPSPELRAIQKTLVWQQAEQVLDVMLRGDRLAVLGVSGLARFTRVEGKWAPGAITSASAPPIRDARGKISDDGESFTMFAPTNLLPGDVFSRASWKNLDFAAEPDGLVHVYNDKHATIATIDNWGSDIATMAGCGVVATGTADRTAKDSVMVWDFVDRKPRPVSDSLELPGAVTALWASPEGAIAIVQRLVEKKYEAYLLTFDCSR